MTHVNFTTSGVALTDTQVARIRRALNQAWRLLRDTALTVCKA
ncbi:MAG: hypothetical protein ACLVBA_16725 [Alistipes finegoldii]